MDAAAVLVWMAPEPPDAAEEATLATWASRRGLTVTAPRDVRPPSLVVDPGIAEEVDSLLARARDALTASDGAGVDEALDAAESRLRAHPELPQAAWLMAEVERARSTRRHRVTPPDPEGALRAWARADVLDGGRLAGLGEPAGAALGSPAASLNLELAQGQRAWLDGRAVAGEPISTRAGLHDLVVTWDDTPVWAAWIAIAPGSSTLEVNAPAAPPCSTGDVDRARQHSDGVRCAAWVTATRGPDPGTVRVALCRFDRCEALETWGAKAPAWTEQAPARPPSRGWPGWATWGLVGAGAAVVAGVSIAVV
ncbi:MAG TPA: hypothetical protein VKU41_01035, partial [Polyangiaceae bacterium]|nr:hypothetical protein [Polyangiaceae bacterium]